MNTSATGDIQVNMSLRLCSEHLLLEPTLNAIDIAIDITADILHVAGQPITYGRMAGRLAKRHYASVASTDVRTDAEITSWCYCAGLTRLVVFLFLSVACAPLTSEPIR